MPTIHSTYPAVVAELLAPHERRLELGELVGAQLLARQNQPDDVLRQQRKAAQIQHLIAVLVDELEHLLHQALGALVLDVLLGGGEQRAHRVHRDAALDEAGARSTQLLQPIVVGRVHDTWARVFVRSIVQL